MNVLGGVRKVVSIVRGWLLSCSVSCLSLLCVVVLVSVWWKIVVVLVCEVSVELVVFF